MLEAFGIGFAIALGIGAGLIAAGVGAFFALYGVAAVRDWLRRER